MPCGKSKIQSTPRWKGACSVKRCAASCKKTNRHLHLYQMQSYTTSQGACPFSPLRTCLPSYMGTDTDRPCCICRQSRSLQHVLGDSVSVRTLCASTDYLKEGDSCQHFNDACCQLSGLTCARLHNDRTGIICIRNPTTAANETISRSLMEARLMMARSDPPLHWMSSGARARRLDEDDSENPASPDPLSELVSYVNPPPLNGEPRMC